MENSNVVQFPKQKRDAPPQSMEETMERIVNNRITYSKSFCSDVMDIIYSAFGSDNIDLENPRYFYDVELLQEALMSLHLKANGVGYFMQDVAVDMFETVEPDVEELLEEVSDNTV